MKYLLMLAVLTAVICGLSGCASTGSTDPVPGERTGEESRLQPGTGAGPNASLKW